MGVKQEKAEAACTPARDWARAGCPVLDILPQITETLLPIIYPRAPTGLLEQNQLASDRPHAGAKQVKRRILT